MKRAALVLAALALAAPALAVGLGPLSKSGVTDTDRKGFFLTLINPYPAATAFRAYAVGAGDETPQPRVRILPGEATLGGRTTRRILVVATGLAPGETYAFRVCAELAHTPKGMIHARVCSNLSARRLPRA
jgi:hypothetical protein